MASHKSRRTTAPPTAVMEPPRAWPSLSVREVWDARELVLFLAWRDVKIRYTQAVLGAAWAVLQPLLLMAVFAVVLGRLAKIPSPGVPYTVFVFTGLAVWTFFANGVSAASESLVATPNLITKVYLARLALPLGSLIAWLPDLLISLVILVIIMGLHGIAPASTVVLLPLFIVLGVTVATGVSIWLSALNVTYRDVRYAVPFLLNLGMFTTPVLYPPTLVPASYRPLLGLNPMSGVVEGFRWAILHRHPASWSIILISAVVGVGIAATGLIYFRRVEHAFADVV